MKTPDVPGTLEKRVLEAYGKTDDPRLTVWMLRDGTLVNGSLEGWQRDTDHREIADFYPGLDEETAMARFMRRGNVRMGFSDCGPCFEFLVPLSEAQLRQLVPWAHWAARNKTDFCAIRHARGNRVCENPWQFLYYISKWMKRNVFDYPLDPDAAQD